MPYRYLTNLLYTVVLLPGLVVAAEPLTVAVASNFVPAAEEIAAQFSAATGNDLRISAGSTGKLYAQISNGAPYDIFLAADSERPALLEANTLGVKGTRFTYAIGGLVLWSRDSSLKNGDCRAHLENLGRHHLAIANPITAPYGAAAREFLMTAGLWDRVASQLVFGENISQALQFVVSGNASIGLIARAQSVDNRLPAATCKWLVPETTHQALEHQAVLLRRATHNTAALKFLEFLKSSSAQEIIVRYGYAVPR
jgi:molybdate transport system substrate-binding protein